MVEDHDIIIAGAGPAGLTAAKAAAENGMEVLLLEMKAQIGQSQTASWIPSEFLDEYSSEAVKSEIHELELHSPHKDLKVEGDFGKIIDREKFEKRLASEAVEAGADIWLGAPVRELLEKRGKISGVKIESGNWSEEIESEGVIDATGAGARWASIFRRQVQNMDWDEEKNTQTNEYLMSNSTGREKIDLYFNSLFAPRGYAWIHSFGEGRAMAGIRGVRIHPDSALDEFIGRESPSRLSESVPIGEYRRQLPVQGPISTMADDGIIAVGAAAGQVYPLSAHGLKYAVESGKMAGEVMASAVSENDLSEDNLSGYEKDWREKFEKEMKVGELLLDSLEISPDQKMDSLVDYLEGKEELKESFLNIFLAKDLETSLKVFFKGEEPIRLFGEERVERILSLYS